MQVECVLKPRFKKCMEKGMNKNDSVKKSVQDVNQVKTVVLSLNMGWSSDRTATLN